MDPAWVAPQTREWALTAMARIGKKLDGERVETKRHRKLLIVHLDGVPRAVLQRAIEEGRMPFLSRMVKSGAYHFDHAFWGTPASTPAFQAGVLYGLRHPNLPAYTWYERDLGKLIRMNAPKDAEKIEARVNGMLNGRGTLLEDGGTTYLSLFQAQASNQLAMTSLAHPLEAVPDFFGNLGLLRSMRRRSLWRYAASLADETFSSAADALRWAKQVKSHRHEFQFMLNRFFVVSLGWGVAWNRALVDMVRGVPAIYLVFGNFDEVAHRRGPFSPQALRELYAADSALEELYVMGRLQQEPYDMVLVTDHGHVDSVPFERRLGRKLEDYLLDPAPVPLSPDIERALRDGRELPDTVIAPHGKPVVVESGNFSHVYLNSGTKALEALELLAAHRNALARAVQSEDIGIVAVRRGDGAVAIIGGGVYGPNEIDQAPLSHEFSRRAVADLLRELPFMPTAGDLVLFGEAVRKSGTVGFAWEFGSHGGLTSTETDSVVLWPSNAGLDLRGLSHSTQLYERLSEVYRH